MALPKGPALARLGGTALAVPAVVVGFGGGIAFAAALVLVVLWWGRGAMALATIFLAVATLAALVAARSPRAASAGHAAAPTRSALESPV